MFAQVVNALMLLGAPRFGQQRGRVQPRGQVKPRSACGPSPSNGGELVGHPREELTLLDEPCSLQGSPRRVALVVPAVLEAERAEEHTSEVQSRQYLVCRLLLEKKQK